MTTKLKNKINKRGKFLCGGYGDKGCGTEVTIGTLIKGVLYYLKCSKEIKGAR